MSYPGFAESMAAAVEADRKRDAQRGVKVQEAAGIQQRQPLTLAQVAVAVFVGNLMTGALAALLYAVLR